jgi:4-phytase/acid phosphatase
MMRRFGFGMDALLRFLGRGVSPRMVAVILIALMTTGSVGRAAQDSYGDELRLVIILTRHGVRSPLLSNEQMARYAALPWPKWETAPSIQTPHGNALIALMGDYYRQRFLRSGLLSGDPAADGPLVFIRADNDQRTIETARILGKSLVPVGEPDVHALPSGTIDPLFRPFRARLGHPDSALAAASVLGRMGGDPRNIETAYATQFTELKDILFGHGVTPPESSGLNAPSTITPGQQEHLVKLSGPLMVAEECTDSFLLQYADGMPSSDVGWGKVDGKVMTDMLALHELLFDLTDRTFYPAQVGASNLASHIVDSLEQGALGQPVPGAFGPAGERIVVITGHDSNQAAIGGLFGMNWCLPGTQMNPMLPGGALVFELWRRGGPQEDFYVRTSYVAQTLDQQRDSVVLSLDKPPAQSPIFIPGCGGPGPNFDAPLKAFVRQARRVIDPAFIAPEP